ncbi:MAG: hypothetical protein LWY06_05910 [Firmicutes bacterium]|nr:hypothetical protein [Bacillota bacterium]
MKTVKIFGLIVLLVALAGLWIIGCTGEGAYDTQPQPTGSVSPTVSPTPTPTSTSTVTPTPTGSPTPGAETLKQLVSNRANVFDIKIVGGYLYWVEQTSTPSGGVFRIKSDGSGDIETIITGLNNPSALGFTTGDDGNTYMFVGSSEGSTGAVIRRVNVSNSSFPAVTLTTGASGTIPYMVVSGTIYFTRNAGSGGSTLSMVDAFPNATPTTAEDIGTSLTNAFDVKVFSNTMPGSTSRTFALVTERMSSGRVLIYDITNTSVLPITPVVVSSSNQKPTRVTFQPDYESDNTTPVTPMAGYVYWTNYDGSSGQVCRQKIKWDTTANAVVLDGTKQIVAQALKFPYDIKVPNDMCSGSLKGTLKKLLVSSNISEANAGNWYVIDVSNSNNFPLNPSSSQITDMSSTPMAYPLNGIVTYTSSQLTNYFSSFNDATGGNNDGTIYYYRHKFTN